MQDLALEFLLTGDIGQVGNIGIEAGRNHHEVEVFLMQPTTLLYGDGPARRTVGSRRQRRHPCPEANVRADLEWIGIVLQVFLEDGSRREIRSALGQRPVRELVEFLLDLDTKIRITVRPDAAQPFGAFEDCAVEPFRLKGLRRGESGNSRPNDSHALYIFQIHLPGPLYLAGVG